LVQCVAVWCSVLQFGVVCCSLLQCVAVWCSVLQFGAVCCSLVQCVAVWCSVLQFGAVCSWSLKMTCAYVTYSQVNFFSPCLDMHCELPTTLAALKEGKWGLEGKGWGEGKGGGEGKNQCAHKK